MKKALVFFVLLLFMSTVNVYAELKGETVNKYPFYVYTDFESSMNHFIPSGFMGDIKDMKLSCDHRMNTKRGATCIRIEYAAKLAQESWAGVYWQNPERNWGNVKGGFNLSKAKKLFLYARGEKGGETVEMKFGGITGNFPDSASDTTGVIELTKQWQLYEIDLADWDLSYINGGFCIVFTVQDNPKGCVVYLDEIYYASEEKPVEKDLKGKSVNKFPFYIYADAKGLQNKYSPSGYMGDASAIKAQDSKDNPYKGRDCMEIQYKPKENDKNKWAGICWQNPKKNWGNKKGGYDLSSAKTLVFNIRGKNGGEVINVSLGGTTGKYPDSTGTALGEIKLTKAWKEYRLDLNELDLSYISGGFCVTFASDKNQAGCTFYLDEVYYSEK